MGRKTTGTEQFQKQPYGLTDGTGEYRQTNNHTFKNCKKNVSFSNDILELSKRKKSADQLLLKPVLIN